MSLLLACVPSTQHHRGRPVVEGVTQSQSQQDGHCMSHTCKVPGVAKFTEIEGRMVATGVGGRKEWGVIIGQIEFRSERGTSSGGAGSDGCTGT